VLVHQAKLPADEITVHRGIPVTTVPRTLLDLAAVLPTRQVERAINEAEVRHLWDELSLEHLLRRYPRRAGNSTARAALQSRRGGTTLTRSELEEMFLVLVDEAGLPRPEVNALVEGYEVDAVWWAARVVVELDGRDTHGTTTAFETDRERDRRLVAAQWRPIRVTFRQMTRTRAALIEDLMRLVIGATLAA
jgi:very-short-patch-repair endonuclease